MTKTQLVTKERTRNLVNDFTDLIKKFSNGENRITVEQNQYHVKQMNHYNTIIYGRNMDLCSICGFVKQSGYDGYKCYNHKIENQISVGFRTLFGVGN